jgi:pimeloyl-ACP methyl ester carboxylesterase
MIGHSWGGACATAYALAFPDRTSGLVLLSTPTHPWPGDPGWYNKLASLPYVGPVFLRTFVYPLGVLLVDGALRNAEARPIRSDTRVKLVTAIARARHWLSEIEAGTAIDAIATRQACSKRHVHMTVSLAFLAPSLVDGRLPRGIGVARLFDARRSHGRVSIKCWDTRIDAVCSAKRLIHRQA